MRTVLVAAMLLVVSALAGCSGKKGGGGDDDLHYTCPDGTEIHGEDYEGVLENITVDFLKTKCPKGNGGTGTGNGGGSNSTPNVPPVIGLVVKDDGGNATNVTMLMGNLTFDASSSSDADGEIAAIAITVTDSNTTRTKSLYDVASKTFTPATFKFDRAGVVNVTVSMIDDRAGFTTMARNVYVNRMEVVGPYEISGNAATEENTNLTDPCRGAGPAVEPTGGQVGAPLIDAAYFKTGNIMVEENASFIEAIPHEDTLITICAPDDTAISDEKSNVAVTSNAPLVMPPSTDSYFIGMYASGQQVPAGATVIVHYEPQAAAAEEPEA